MVQSPIIQAITSHTPWWSMELMELLDVTSATSTPWIPMCMEEYSGGRLLQLLALSGLLLPCHVSVCTDIRQTYKQTDWQVDRQNQASHVYIYTQYTGLSALILPFQLETPCWCLDQTGTSGLWKQTAKKYWIFVFYRYSNRHLLSAVSSVCFQTFDPVGPKQTTKKLLSAAWSVYIQTFDPVGPSADCGAQLLATIITISFDQKTQTAN